MSLKVKFLSSLIVVALLMSACSNNKDDSAASKQKVENQQKKSNSEKSEKEEKANYAESYLDAVTELEKAKNGEEVDYDKVINLYKTELQSLVQKRDSEFNDTIDQSITTALEAGKSETMDKVIVKQIFDKLMQKVFYTTILHELSAVVGDWENTDKVNKEIEDAKYFYSIIEGTVQKRDTAYETTMVDTIRGGFDEIDNSVKTDNQQSFLLGKQIVDKTLMKTFYLATGALPNGYATKAANEAKENAGKAKVEQAEGWAFYQSIFAYLNGSAPDEAAFILSQFDLQTDVKSIDPDKVNKAFIRGFSKIALHEYEESEENWGNDRSVMTALEGALFIDIIGEDLKGLLTEDGYNSLNEQAQQYFDAAKAGDKESGLKVLEKIENSLHVVIEKAN